ncbi:MAG: PorP/SprF family type IX secretion system membrane protein [Bacteroidia bacterium]|nr:PorP/SprF family type IX secretion system membrane protein [Bacteroidia bacterium]
MKIKIIGLLAIGCYTGLYAQQLPQQSQYMFNDLMYNPAVAGTRDYYQAISNNRYQWIGIVDAPRTYMLSVYGPNRGLNMGYGGYIFNDVTGPTSRTGLNAAYAYQFKATEDLKISLGLSLGLLQYKVDFTKITFKEEEKTIENELNTDYMPDANFGVYVFSSKYYGCFSVNQLFNNRIKIYDKRADSDSRLKNINS